MIPLSAVAAPRVVLVALALLPHVIKLACYPTYPGFDDAFIHLRVADNVAHGKGWGANWRAWREVAEFLAADAAPGDTVFAVSDIACWPTTRGIDIAWWMRPASRRRRWRGSRRATRSRALVRAWRSSTTGRRTASACRSRRTGSDASGRSRSRRPG